MTPYPPPPTPTMVPYPVPTFPIATAIADPQTGKTILNIGLSDIDITMFQAIAYQPGSIWIAIGVACLILACIILLKYRK